jgi:glucose-6-phosphate 1-dehydrogenase
MNTNNSVNLSKNEDQNKPNSENNENYTGLITVPNAYCIQIPETFSIGNNRYDKNDEQYDTYWISEDFRLEVNSNFKKKININFEEAVSKINSDLLNDQDYTNVKKLLKKSNAIVFSGYFKINQIFYFKIIESRDFISIMKCYYSIDNKKKYDFTLTQLSHSFQPINE